MQILQNTVSYYSMKSTKIIYSPLDLKNFIQKEKRFNIINTAGQQVMNKKKKHNGRAFFYRFFNVTVSSVCEHLNLSFG